MIAAVTVAAMFGPAAYAQTAVVESSTTTAPVPATTTATVTQGTISEFSPNTIVVRSTTSPEPIRYVYRKTTTYVDETGAPVSIDTVKSGLPVTVHYVKEGNDMVASRVVVRKTTTAVQPAPAVVEKRATTTTTTTSKKVDEDDDDEDDD